MYRSLSAPEKLDGELYGVLCLVIGKYGNYRKMVKFDTLAKAQAFFVAIPLATE
jgi:hypothetical protein